MGVAERIAAEGAELHLVAQAAQVVDMVLLLLRDPPLPGVTNGIKLALVDPVPPFPQTRGARLRSTLLILTLCLILANEEIGRS